MQRRSFLRLLWGLIGLTAWHATLVLITLKVAGDHSRTRVPSWSWWWVVSPIMIVELIEMPGILTRAWKKTVEEMKTR